MKFLEYTLSFFLWSFLVLFLACSQAQSVTKDQLATQSSQASSIDLSTQGSHKKILRDGGEDYYVLVNLTAPEVKNDKKLPLNVAIVIDRSGSMADKGKLEYAKKAAKAFIEKLSAEDRLALVEYDDQISVLSPSKIVGQNRKELMAMIDKLEPRGSTNLAAGMMKGGDQVQEYLSDQKINRVLLLSDGLANTGVSDLSSVAALAEKLGDKGIQVSTFGLGADFDEDMMTRIADASAGNYYFIESPTQIAGIFEKERHALSSVVAKKVKLILEFSEQVNFEDVSGYAFKQKGKKVIVELPDLYSSQKRKVLFRVTPQIKEGGKIEVATLTFEYQDVLKDLEQNRVRQVVTAEVTRDRDEFEKSANIEVIVESAQIVSASQVDQAMRSYQKGDSQTANSFLGQAKALLKKAYDIAPSPTLAGQISDMDEAKSNMNNYAPESESGKILIKDKKAEAREQQQMRR